MHVLRTPDERFAQLQDYPFSPNYVMVDDLEGGELRIHYLDEGDKTAPPILMLHGEPSWSYLYRKMIGPLVAAGHRVIVPDLVGFGRSDKPAQQKDHSYSRHVQWMTLFLESLDLQRMTLMCQDWGGLIGLRLVAEHGARFDRVLAANTMLPGFPMFKPEVKAVFGIKAALQTTLAFGSWLSYSQFNPSWQAGQILQFGTAHKLTQPEIDAYNAPFPDRSYMAGARVFPRLVPTDRQANIVAWRALRQWQKPFLCAFSDRDPIMSKMTGVFPALIPGCRGQAHTTIGKAGHFLQDDQGEPLAGVLNAFIANTPS